MELEIGTKIIEVLFGRFDKLIRHIELSEIVEIKKTQFETSTGRKFKSKLNYNCYDEKLGHGYEAYIYSDEQMDKFKPIIEKSNIAFGKDKIIKHLNRFYVSLDQINQIKKILDI